MENVDFSATLGEAKDSQELSRITSFIYDMTKDELPQIADRNFSFYRCLAQKLAMLNSQTLEEELAPPRISPCLDATQSPPTIGKCGNTEDSTHAKPTYSEPVVLKMPPADTPRLKPSLAARLNREEPKMFHEKAAEEELPFNEVVVGISIFAEEDPHTKKLSRTNADAQLGAPMQVKGYKQVRKNAVTAPSKELNFPMYRLESVRCSKEEVVIRVTANGSLASQVISTPPLSPFDIHKEVRIPREERRKIIGDDKMTEQKSCPSAAEVAKGIGNSNSAKPLRSRKNSANSEARKRRPLRDRASIKKLAKAAEGEMSKLSEDSKYVKFGSNFFMRVSALVNGSCIMRLRVLQRM
eukprot:TRINITY_DN5003_c0_g1_i4.p1 TRINITY_DN5003_c0_g1~~TRINITY_DN5003_c0_g1_i4.p1  ORF type:complete len:354 (+),score=50.24 TRINITY_DN5003_c0_g1_i4:29-1090(+)